MKITAEFNSNEELLSFISTFGTKNFTTLQEVGQAPKVKNEVVTEVKKDIVQAEPPKKEAPKVEAEVVGVDKESTEMKDAEIVKKEDTKDEESKITKEMVRAIFTKIIKAGKAKEAKELTSKYGASKLPDLKEEHYVEVYKEAEALL